MKNLMNLLHYLGISIDINNSTSPIVLLAFSILGLSTIGLLCFVNILIYISILYITEHKIFLDKISKYILLVKIVNLYRKTRIAFIIFEVVLFFFSIGSVIWFCFRIIISV